MAFKMNKDKAGSLYKKSVYKNSTSFKNVEGDEKKTTTVKMRRGGNVTIDEKGGKTYNREASINRLMDKGYTRAQAIAELDASLAYSKSKKTAGGKNPK